MGELLFQVFFQVLKNLAVSMGVILDLIETQMAPTDLPIPKTLP